MSSSTKTPWKSASQPSKNTSSHFQAADIYFCHLTLILCLTPLPREKPNNIQQTILLPAQGVAQAYRHRWNLLPLILHQLVCKAIFKTKRKLIMWLCSLFLLFVLLYQALQLKSHLEFCEWYLLALEQWGSCNKYRKRRQIELHLYAGAERECLCSAGPVNLTGWLYIWK